MTDRNEAPAELTAEEIEAVSGGDGGYLGSGNAVGGGLIGSSGKDGENGGGTLGSGT